MRVDLGGCLHLVLLPEHGYIFVVKATTSIVVTRNLAVYRLAVRDQVLLYEYTCLPIVLPGTGWDKIQRPGTFYSVRMFSTTSTHSRYSSLGF